VQLSIDDLATLDTSFSAKLAKASILSRQQGAAPGDAAVSTAGWSSDSPDSVGVWWSTSNYVSLGDWFKQLLEELEKEESEGGYGSKYAGPQPDESDLKSDEQESYSNKTSPQKPEGYSTQPAPGSSKYPSSEYEQPKKYSRKFAPYVPMHPRLPVKTEEACLQEVSRSYCGNVDKDYAVVYQ
jgi:hypothetical protein